jgi:hypothetical protein
MQSLRDGCGRVKYAFRNWSAGQIPGRPLPTLYPAQRLLIGCCYYRTIFAPSHSHTIVADIFHLLQVKMPFGELGLAVFAPLRTTLLGLYAFEEIQTLSAIRPEWITR